MGRRIVGALGTFFFFAGAGHLAIGRWRAALGWLLFDALCWSAIIFGALGGHTGLVYGGLGLDVIGRLVAAVIVLRASASDATHPRARSVALSWGALFVVAWLQATTIRHHVVEAYKIPAGSMIPTLEVGDHMFVDRRVSDVHRGDVVVFRYPKNPELDFVKRVVAIGGDTIELKDRGLILNGQPVPARALGGECSYRDFAEELNVWETRPCEAFEETLDGHTYRIQYDPGSAAPARPSFTVPAGAFFVLGDNRDNSHDSRFWGAVPLDHLKGKAIFVWWSSDDRGVRADRIGIPVR